MIGKKNSALIIIVLLIVGAIYYLEGTNINPGSSDNVQEPTELKDGLYPKAPELVGISGYLNSNNDLKIRDLEGKVVLVDFWTYTCINCIRTLPHLVSWNDKYSDDGLVIIGVHTPEFEFEKDYNNVQNAIEKYGIEYPVVQDNDYSTWRAYSNQYWPHKYLIDSEGFIRYDHIGEGGYEEIENVIKELLLEINEMDFEDGLSIPDITPTTGNTRELYAGFNFALPRGQNIGNLEGLQPSKIINYSIPNDIKWDVIYLEGEWFSNPDDLELKSNEGIIVVSFVAKSVNIVSGNNANPVIVEVFIDGEYITKADAGLDVMFENEKAFILVDNPELYNVYDGDYERRRLELRVKESDFYFNAFTFG